MNADRLRRDHNKETDMEETSKQSVLAPRDRIFAVVQFAVYMGLFALYYTLNPDATSNPEWRLYLIVALAAGVVCSVIPALAGPEEVFSYAGVIAPLMIFALFGAGYSFYTWSVPDARDALSSLALSYLVLAPICSLFVLYVAM